MSRFDLKGVSTNHSKSTAKVSEHVFVSTRKHLNS